MTYAAAYGHFLTICLVLGLAGGSFSVGTPYAARWFPKNRQGMAMGVFCAGNSGAAVNKFVAPAILVVFGWTMVPKVYAVITLITLIRVRRLRGALAVDGAVLRGWVRAGYPHGRAAGRMFLAARWRAARGGWDHVR